MSEPLPSGEIAEEHLAPPKLSLGTTARTVEGHTNDRRGPCVLGKARGDVRVVVLHANAWQSAGLRPPRRGVVGMEIMGHHDRQDAEEAFELRDRLLEERATLDALEIADVLRQM